MTVVDCVHRESDVPEAARTFSRETITLGWEARTRAHARRRSDGGVEFGTSLPRGTVLRAGDCFVLDAERVVVVVAEQLEPVFVIEPASPPEWALFAYQIGNRHQPVMITDRTLVCPEVPGIEDLLRQHHMPYARAMRAFTPVSGVAPHSH